MDVSLGMAISVNLFAWRFACLNHHPKGMGQCRKLQDGETLRPLGWIEARRSDQCLHSEFPARAS